MCHMQVVIDMVLSKKWSQSCVSEHSVWLQNSHWLWPIRIGQLKDSNCDTYVLYDSVLVRCEWYMTSKFAAKISICFIIAKGKCKSMDYCLLRNTKYWSLHSLEDLLFSFSFSFLFFLINDINSILVVTRHADIYIPAAQLWVLVY